jgi:hypothetical protein
MSLDDGLKNLQSDGLFSGSKFQERLLPLPGDIGLGQLRPATALRTASHHASSVRLRRSNVNTRSSR